jgi:pimeloyl-ACP methyl ester carboxylesterase
MGMQPLDIPVDGGSLRALRFGDGPRLVLAAHGITASAMSFVAVARHLPREWSLIALDLRGRGGGAGMSGPYGITAHAADLAAAAEFIGAPVVLIGQSLGAYAALRAAADRPELFSRLVLVDGGLPLPVPEAVDPDQLLERTIGPAIARLRQTFPDLQAYLDFFKAHPALAADWNEDLAEYVRYDATGEPGAIRSRVNSEAVYADGRDLLLNAASFGDDLQRLRLPTALLHAPRGMLGDEPGLLPRPIVDHWAAQVPVLQTELVEGTNHYTILMSDRAAQLISRRLTQSAVSQSRPEGY